MELTVSEQKEIDHAMMLYRLEKHFPELKLLNVPDKVFWGNLETADPDKRIDYVAMTLQLWLRDKQNFDLDMSNSKNKPAVYWKNWAALIACPNGYDRDGIANFLVTYRKPNLKQELLASLRA